MAATPGPKLELRDVLGILKHDYASQWDDIGRALKVNEDYRSGLRAQGLMTSNRYKLESILQKWLQSHCSPPTWDNLIEALKEEQLVTAAEKVEKYLTNDEDGIRKYGWKDSVDGAQFGMADSMSSDPTPSQFLESLPSVSGQWYDLGILLGAPVHELDTIERNHRGDAFRCLLEVYQSLRSRRSDLSWAHIAKALRRMNKHNIADQIYSEYMKYGEKDHESATERANTRSSKEYQEWFDKASDEGVVDSQWTNVSIGGASGTGKTSFLNLLLLKEPITTYNSTPVLKSEPVYIMDEADSKKMKKKQKATTTADISEDHEASKGGEDSTSESGSSTESDSEEEVPDTVKEMSQHVFVADANNAGDDYLWKVAEKDALLEKIAEEVHALANDNTAEQANRPVRPPWCNPDHLSTNSDSSQASSLPTDPTVRGQPIALPPALEPAPTAAQKRILDMLPLIKRYASLGCTHWIHLLDTGGQACFIDIAPALFRFNSINIVLHKLDEELDDFANFFFSIEGKVVGRECRKITNAQLLRSLFSSRMGLKKPDLNGLAGVQLKLLAKHTS